MNDQFCPSACRADNKDFAFFQKRDLSRMHGDPSHLLNQLYGIQCMREHLAYCNKVLQYICSTTLQITPLL